jgi:HlyD family secretion protein
MSRKKKILIGAGVLVVLGGVAFANFRFKRTVGITVNTEAVKKRKLDAIVSASGKIQPKRFVNISADTSGRVTDLAVNEGDRVTQGQFLMQIDPRNLRTRVTSGEASLGAAQSTAEQLKLSLESSRTQLKLAQDNYKRQQELWKGGLTTREQFERAESELRVREQDLRAQEQNVLTQTQRMRQEQATLENARTDLSKVRIESPINGIVTRRNIEQGETAVVGTMNNAGTILLQVADMSIIEAEVEVDETDIPNVKIGQLAKITVDAMTGKTFTAKVTEIGNSPIQTTGQTASQATNFKVTLQVDGEIPDVRPGFTCTAEITTASRESVLAVPIQATTVREMVIDEKGAIVREPVTPGPPRRPASGGVQAAELKPGHERKEVEGVFVVRDGKAMFEVIKTGIAGEKYFEVLSGLKDGDAVIIGPFSSVRSLADGAAVKLEEAPRATATTAK